MRAGRGGFGAVAGLAALLLVGCGSDDKPAATPATTTAPGGAATEASPTSTTSEPTASATEATTSAPAAAAGEFTAPDTKLKLGEKALVPFVSQKKGGTLGLVATGIKKGAAADLAPLKLGDRAKGLTPFYITFKVTNESGTDFSYASMWLTNGVLADGSTAQKLSVIGDFAPCENNSADKAFTTKGASYETCIVALASGDAEVTGVEYHGSKIDEAVMAGTPSYTLNPVVWTK
jgi:hypothetical protein